MVDGDDPLVERARAPSRRAAAAVPGRHRSGACTLMASSALTAASGGRRSLSSSSLESFMAGISAPGLSDAGSSTHARSVLGACCATTPAPSVRRLMRCVRSGPNTPLAGVPRTVWQLMHASEREQLAPGARRGIVAGRAPAAPPTQRSNSSRGCTTTASSMPRVLGAAVLRALADVGARGLRLDPHPVGLVRDRRPSSRPAGAPRSCGSRRRTGA